MTRCASFSLRRVAAALTIAVLGIAGAAHAESVNVAVAANFTEPAKALAVTLKETTGHDALLSFGATGAFYTQIKEGAPFDVFLAADDERPRLLEEEGAIVPGSRFTYAIGQLVLWSAQENKVDDAGKILASGDFNKLAIANPKLAPYGLAAEQTMDWLGLADALRPKLVIGASIGQTLNFVATGNADIGFVARSQVLEDGQLKGGSAWTVPAEAHAPIVQDAVILKRGADNPAAKAWVELLQSADTRALLQARYGYATPD